MSSLYIVIRVDACGEQLAHQFLTRTHQLCDNRSLSPASVLFDLDENEIAADRGTLSIDAPARFENGTLVLAYEAAPSVGDLWLREILLKLRSMTPSAIHAHTFSTQDSSTMFLRFVDATRVEVLIEQCPAYRQLSAQAAETVEHALVLDAYWQLSQTGTVPHEVLLDLNDQKIARMRRQPLYRLFIWGMRITLLGVILFGVIKCSQALF